MKKRMIDLSKNATYVSIVVDHDNRRYLDEEVQIDHVLIIIIFFPLLLSSMNYTMSCLLTRTADFVLKHMSNDERLYQSRNR